MPDSKGQNRASSHRRDDYQYFVPINTRWQDNDVYGHINNVVYYSYFDTTANHYLINEAGLDIANSDIIGVVVSSGCNYFSSAAYPQMLEGALRVGHLGNSSVNYELAIFRQGDNEALAAGHFTHVFVQRRSQKPVTIPATIRSALKAIAAK